MHYRCITIANLGQCDTTKGAVRRYTSGMTAQQDDQEIIKIQVRMPRWMRDELNALRQGRRIKRSLNAEIVAGLDQYLTDQHAKDGLDAPRG